MLPICCSGGQLVKPYIHAVQGSVPKFNLIEIWIDDEKVDPLNPTFMYSTVPIRHQAILTPGKHSVKVSSPVLHAVIFDGEIIFNGIDINLLTVQTCKTSGDPCEITIEKRHNIIFQGSRKDLKYIESFTSKQQALTTGSNVDYKNGV